MCEVFVDGDAVRNFDRCKGCSLLVRDLGPGTAEPQRHLPANLRPWRAKENLA